MLPLSHKDWVGVEGEGRRVALRGLVVDGARGVVWLLVF